MKRILCLLLCLCLLVPALPVQGADQSESGALCQKMSDDYRTILTSTNRSSLAGYCGLCASWQLYLIGVNDWVMSYHGCNQFDAYCDLAVTGGGHRVEAYSYRDYTLTEALNTLCKNGTRDVYNILVGFETTNTALGAIYGHSMVIYGILDGVVHFCESYATPFGPAGTPIRTSIEEFAAYYDGRGVFEGLIYFGKAGYAANCKKEISNLFLEVTADSCLYTQPCLPGTEDSAVARQVRRGERLWANALLENPDGGLFYRVDDSGRVGYLPVENTKPFRFIYEDITIVEESLPERLQPGRDFPITGRISAEYGDVTGVSLEVTDSAGRVVLNNAMAKHSGVYDLERDIFSRMLDFGTLPEGGYTYTVTAYGANAYWDGGVRYDKTQRVLLCQPFAVGEGNAPEILPPEVPVKDGWIWENNTWYCYRQGQPRTGWYCCGGGDYYLKEDGSVTTGWAIVGGQPRYFSGTGCMRTGWLDTPEGRMYLQFNGVPATGERTVDGRVYQFDVEGYLIQEGP